MKLRVKCTLYRVFRSRICFGPEPAFKKYQLHYVQEVLSILKVYKYIQMDKTFRHTEYFEDYINNFKVKILFPSVQEVVPRFT